MENKSFAEINNRNRRHLNLNKRSVFIICILIALISIALRYPRDLNQNFINSDATWHVLLTMEAYDQTSPSIHKYLPIVTLGDEVNKNIHWGATLPDSYGNMYYTSFSGLGFLAPYLFVKLFHLPINPQSLYLFSSLLYLLSFIMIAKIMLKLFKEELSDVIIIAVSGLYLVQPEIIHSQGVVYWHQSLYMLVFLCQTYFFIEQKQMWRKLAFLILCLIGPFLEWTGFIANIGFGLIYFFNSFKQLKNSNESFEYRYYNLLFFMGVALMTFLSGIMFISHFLLVIDFKTLIQSLNFRFGARRVTESVRLIDLLMGYKQSFGFLIIITLGLFSTTVIVPKFRSEFFKSLKETNNGKVLFVSSFAILENFLMMQHATQYSFDRIKIIIPMIILIMSCLTAISKINIKLFNRICIVLFFTVVLTSSLFLSNYCLNKSPYKFDALYIQNNKEIADNLKKEYTTENSIYICDNVVRGYFTQLFERNVYEHIKYEDAINIAYAKNKRYVVYIETNLHPWQLSEIKDVKIIDTDEVVQDYSKFFLTDENWERGYSVKFAGFYIPNTTTNREKFKVSNKILLDNGEEREIIEVIENGQYVHVKVEGDLFTCEPYPIDLEIVE